MKLLNRAYREYRRRKSWQRIVHGLAMIVVFCTTYALILPAITMETGTVCGLTEHTHTQECYESVTETQCTLPEHEGHTHSEECYGEVSTLICELAEVEAHTHGEDCWEQKLICELEERQAHVHTEECVGTVETLVCTEDHEHMGTCWLYEEGYVCALEETEGHSHGEACYESVLICAVGETEGHAHTEECYALTQELICGMEESEGHSHADDPVPGPVCGLEEHTHDESCYPETEPETVPETTLPMGDPDADMEAPENWEESVSAAELKYDWSEDLIAVARTQLGYQESQRNYIYTEDGDVLHYTRYGQWYGEPYSKWSAMFVSFCLEYAGVEGIEAAQDCSLWLDTLNEAEIYREKTQYTPVTGDIAFFDRDLDGISDHVGIVEEVIPATEAECEKLQLIAGGWEGSVARYEISVDEQTLLGYAILPTEPDSRSYENTDTQAPYIHVELPLDTSVPEDASLTVTEITEAEEQYAQMAGQVEAMVSGAVTGMTVLDISFYDTDGEYISVSDTAQVSLSFEGDVFGANQVKVFHFVDGEPVELTNVAVNLVATAAMDEMDTPSTQTLLTFETEGFSVFAVVEVVDQAQYEEVTVTDATKMAGSYYILNEGSTRAMTASEKENTVEQKSYVAISETEVANTADLSSYSVWTFEWVSGSDYIIYSTDTNGAKQYLMAGNVTGGADNWDLGALELTTDETGATVFTAEAMDTGKVRLYTFNGTNTRYITDLYNTNLGDDYYGFTTHTATDGNHLTLYRAKEYTVPATDLGGKSFVIANLYNHPAAITSTPNANNNRLEATRVETMVIDGVTYVSGQGITEWEFIATKTAGQYYIRAKDTGKYMNLTASRLTTSDTEQAITVSLDEDNYPGKVRIQADNTSVDWYGANGVDTVFGPWNGWGQNNYQTLCQITTTSMLLYNLNQPTTNWRSGTPSIAENYQDITEDLTNLLSVDGRNDVGKFVKDTLAGRTDVREYYEEQNTALGAALTADNYLAPGAEYVFLGWRTTNSDGESILIPEGAPVSVDEDGNVVVTDSSGDPQIIAPGSTLVGEWEMVSTVVIFFVNHGDTMLENEKEKAITSTNNDYYAGVVACGHLYNAKTVSVGPDTTTTHGTILTENHYDHIESELVVEYDPNNPEAQIVIDALVEIPEGSTSLDQANFIKATGAQEPQIEAAVMEYLRNNPVDSKKIKLGSATLDQREINTENYKLYWYVQKQEPYDHDSWHIDGVLVANTQPMIVVKTFSGLEREDTDKLIEDMSFPMYLVRDNGTNQTAEYYYTMDADGTETGIYEYNGPINAANNIYQWTLESVQGQRYAFQETGYELDNYDYFSLVSVHYTDQVSYTVDPMYKYNTDTTFPGVSPPKTAGGSASYTGTDYFQSQPLIGGDVQSVIFANFYTPKGTGMFSISKTADEEGQNRLPGAVFRLTDSEGKVVSAVNNNADGNAVTNAYGSIHYSGLQEGTYTLTEITPPAGYQKIENTWKVEVARDLEAGEVTDDTQVTVTIWEVDENGSEVSGTRKLVYDRLGTAEGNTTGHKGVQEIYQIQNEPYEESITVKKTFATISDAELAQLRDKGYCIEVWQEQANGSFTLFTTLNLENADLIPEIKNGFTWTLSGTETADTSDDVEVKWSEWTSEHANVRYKFIERYYLHDNYFDTVVSANHTSEAVSDLPAVTKIRDSETGTETAEFTITKSDSADTVSITNDYTNTFQLKIIKVDATDGNKPLPGVKFDLYGAANYSTDVSQNITYIDKDGNSQTVYYIDTTQQTDENGVTVFEKMTLTPGSKSFIFVIDEVEVPGDKYVELVEPIVRVVNVDADYYHNGIYELTVENYQEFEAAVSVTATKQWDLPEGMDTTSVELNLYQKDPAGNVTLVHSVTLDGTDKEDTKDNITATVTGWSVTWSGLSYADSETRYEYYVSETHMDGYSTSYYTDYGTTVEKNSVTIDGKTEQVTMVLAKGEKELARSVTVTNTSGFELPSTGGVAAWYAPLGLMLMAAAAWLYQLGIHKRKKQGGGNTS